jgi:hypothetical protein
MQHQTQTVTPQGSPDARQWDDKGRTLLLQMLVHLADLANPARPFHLASAWAERVVTEFLRQGDAEEARGLAVSAPCDRSKVCMPQAQLGFLSLFARPTLDAFGAVAPGFCRLAAPCLEETRLKWEYLKQVGARPRFVSPLWGGGLCCVASGRFLGSPGHEE